MLLWFSDLMNATEKVTIHRPYVSTLLSSAFIRGDLNAARRGPFIWSLISGKLRTCVVKFKLTALFLCLFLVCSQKWCFYNKHYLRCFIFLNDLWLFISVGVTSVTVFGLQNLYLEYKSSMLQIIFHAVLCAAISHRAQAWCQLPRLRKRNQVRISLHALYARVRVVTASHVTWNKKILGSNIHGAFHSVCSSHFPYTFKYLSNWASN